MVRLRTMPLINVYASSFILWCDVQYSFRLLSLDKRFTVWSRKETELWFTNESRMTTRARFCYFWPLVWYQTDLPESIRPNFENRNIQTQNKAICKQANEEHSFELKINGNKIKYFSVLSLTTTTKNDQAKPVAINVINYTDRKSREPKNQRIDQEGERKHIGISSCIFAWEPFYKRAPNMDEYIQNSHFWRAF